LSEPVRIPLGIVVERRKARSEWIDFVWRPVAALAGAPEAEQWTMLKEDGEAASFYAGVAQIELFPTETAYYRDNLATGAPLLWVVLRPSSGAWPYELFKVTADPHEGEALTETGADLIETIAMPDAIAEEIAGFVARHHVEHSFVKRKRERADPEALARKTPAKEASDE
jgi:uncharacterized protein DUF3305